MSRQPKAGIGTAGKPLRRLAVWGVAGAVLLGSLNAALAGDALPVTRTPPASPGTLTRAGADSLSLARATHLWQMGDLRGAVQQLEAIPPGPAPGFALGDRAAFLLAAAHLRLGDSGAFLQVAARGPVGSESPYWQWLSYVRLWLEGAAPADWAQSAAGFWQLPGASELVAAHLLESGQGEAAAALLARQRPTPDLATTHRYLQAVAAERSGADATEHWRGLAVGEPHGATDRELAALGWLAWNAAGKHGQRPAPPLELPPGVGSAHAVVAALAQMLLAAGDSTNAREVLAAAATDAAEDQAARRVRQTAAQLAAGNGDWSAVLAHHAAAVAGWDREAAWLEGLTEPAAARNAWRDWSRPGVGDYALALPRLDWAAALQQVGREAVDLRGEPRFAAPVRAAEEPHSAAALFAAAHAPDPQQWTEYARLTADEGQAQAELGRREYELAGLQHERDLRLDYLAIGSSRALARSADLDQALRELDGLLARLAIALADLDRIRDEALRLFARRAADLADELRTSLIYVQAVRHFHVDGPQVADRRNWPADVPTPGELLGLEQALTGEVLDFLRLFDETVPELVHRSCREVWVPRLKEDGPALRLDLAAQQQQSRQLAAALDAQAAAWQQDAQVAAAETRVARQRALVDSLAVARMEYQAATVAAVVAAGRKRLTAEREGWDYLRGNALYWLAVAHPADPADPTARRLARESGAAAAAALQDYLNRYPDGRARAESRYRLADLELLRARDTFQDRMAGFLGAAPTADDLQDKDLAPFVDYAPAVALYRTILTEDPDYAHRSAVLFQLGMILGDAGEPESAGYLETLIAEYPDSPFGQEASLRLGDQFFEARDYARCQSYFEAAAGGEDVSLQAIALYKLGWAHFERDQFTAAAGSFGQLLDLYEAGLGPRGGRRGADTDLADEAREYLVHALIRAGGAPAYTAHFQAVGNRSYEAEILITMGHQLSGVSLFGEAIACDRLWLARFGERDEALAVSQRLVASYQRWHQPTAARETHLELAARFLPDAAWLTSCTDPDLRREAGMFAREAYRNTAIAHHQQARTDGDPAQWRRALQDYDNFLTHWPDDAEARRLHHQAGEAAHRLGLYAVALDHFELAAGAGPAAPDTAAYVGEAAWQIVAVSDAWYRTAGTDSLARRLLAAGDRFRARSPQDGQLPALMWRQGQVAYAHGWFEQAASVLAELGATYPADTNALAALRMSGDAWYQRQDFLAAEAAYGRTLVLARTLAADSVVTSVTPLVPRCHFQHAEQVAAADSARGPVDAAPFFAAVAGQWPDFPHADLAWYRAGLGRRLAGDFAGATAAWESLLSGYPASVYARDSALNIAAACEQAGQPAAAAAALERFSADFSTDPDAVGALLKAGDLLAAAGDTIGAEATRTTFLTRFADQTETVMAIREERAAKALTGLSGKQSAADLVEVQAYLKLAAEHPEFSSPLILAQVDFHRAQTAHARYTALRLTQPLPPAIAAKQQGLEEVLGLYAACTSHGVAEYTRAAAFRIGEAVTHFGDALLASERPANLAGDDLLAYEEILAEQSWPFFDRGEAAWTELLQQTVGADADPGQWLARTRHELWPRVAQHFAHMPEAEYPLVAAVKPGAATAAGK